MREAIVSFLADPDDMEQRKVCFEKMWVRYFPGLVVYLGQSFGLDSEESRDIAQDTLLAAYGKLHTYSPQYAVSTWLYTIARNKCLDFLRRKKKNSITPELISKSDRGKTLDVTERIIENEVASFIGNLPGDEREIAFLRTYEQLGYREIGELLGIPEGTARSKMYTIKKRLKEKMENWYDE